MRGFGESSVKDLLPRALHVKGDGRAAALCCATRDVVEKEDDAPIRLRLGASYSLGTGNVELRADLEALDAFGSAVIGQTFAMLEAVSLAKGAAVRKGGPLSRRGQRHRCGQRGQLNPNTCAGFAPRTHAAAHHEVCVGGGLEDEMNRLRIVGGSQRLQ